MPADFLVNFGTAGNYRKFKVRGWSQDEGHDDLTWISGNVANIEFAMTPPKLAQTLTLRVMPATSGSLVQSLFIYVNGLFVGFLKAKTTADFSFVVPAGYFSSDAQAPNLLALVAPDAVVPAEIGAGPDQRCLSFGLVHLAIYSVAS